MRVCCLDAREAAQGGMGVMVYKDEVALCAKGAAMNPILLAMFWIWWRAWR